MYGDKKCTDTWELYELGKQYNNSLSPSYYNLVDTNIEFFVGNQWKGLANTSAMARLPKPVFNIIKRIGSLFVASLTSSSSKVTFEPLANKQEGPEGSTQESTAIKAATMATAEVENLFDKFKMDFRIRDAMFDGVQTGDYCAHFYWDAAARPYGGAYSSHRGEIAMEMVDGVNVMFGNPNTHIVEKQPYILIIGRDTVKNLRAEYRQHHKGKSIEEDMILSDNDYQYQASSNGKVELGDTDKTGKSLFVYKYFKKTVEVKLTNPDGSPKMEKVLDKNGKPIPETLENGFPVTNPDGTPVYKQRQATDYKTTVWVSKETKFVKIIEETDTGLTYYPIAWGNWERQKNSYHGRALVTGIVPNQIYINSMFALIMHHQQMLGFPKELYDANVLPQWSNAVGQAIAVYDLPPERRLSDLYSVIQPADMSTQIARTIEMAMRFTKECLGATDAQLGNVNPDNTSALIALQSSSQVPLENPQSCKYEWIEDIGRILLDMMGTYYGERPVVRRETVTNQIVDPTTGLPSTMQTTSNVVETYDFNNLKNLWLQVRADVGASTYWSRIAIVQTLDNLKQSGVLDVLDYLERMPDEYIPRKAELIAKLRGQLETPPAPPGEVPPGPDGMPLPSEEAGPARGVAFGANAENNLAAVIASMPNNTQQMYNNMSTRTKNILLQQAKANMIGG